MVVVVALFIVVVVAMMSYTMMARLSRDTLRTQLLMNHVRVMRHVASSVVWAKLILQEDWKKQKPHAPVDQLPMISVLKTQDGLTVKRMIYDMQSRFNINNLADVDSEKPFERLLQSVMPTLTNEAREHLAASINAWVSAAHGPHWEDQYYLNLPVPYRAAHRLMVVPSELMLVRGMTPALYQALMPYIITLPEKTPINVQTASVPVLCTVDARLTPQLAEEIDRMRQQFPLTQADQFIKMDFLRGHVLLSDSITVVSHYFLLETHVKDAESDKVFYTLLQRLPPQGGVKVYWQSAVGIF
jgi:general secretion pathway protein K